MSRTYNGTSDVITCALGGLGVFGPITVAAIIRRNTPHNGVYDAIVAAGTGTTWEMLFTPSDQANPDAISTAVSGNVLESTTKIVASDGWCICSVTKATGTVAPRVHKVVLSTGTATHQNIGATQVNSGAPATSCYVGSSVAASGDFSKADIYMAGAWNVVLTDTQVEQLAYSKNAWFTAADPKAMWVLDQDVATTDIADFVGTSNQTARSGTSIATTAMPSWTYGS